MPGPRVLEQLERAVVNGSWTEEWNPEEMPRRGTRPKKAEGIISTQCFFLVKTVISSPVPPNSPSYQSQGQTSIKLAPAIWKETCFLQEGSGRVSIPPMWDLPLGRGWGGWIRSVTEWPGVIRSHMSGTLVERWDDQWDRRKKRGESWSKGNLQAKLWKGQQAGEICFEDSDMELQRNMLARPYFWGVKMSQEGKARKLSLNRYTEICGQSFP